MLVSYKWLQSYFDTELPSPEGIVEKLTHTSFEIEGLEEKNGDYIIDVDVLPNRAHDCLCHRGIAGEVSLVTGILLKKTSENSPLTESDTTLSIEIKNNACRRYIGRIMRNIEIKDSPLWLKERLESIGQRSINNVVDATNFVMLEIGQPLHAFDLTKLASEKIIVKEAEEGEKFVTLSGEEVILKKTDLVIADEKDSLVIAGVKGGKKAEVDSGTTTILIEAANFDPVAVRKTSRRLGILTDSSKRYENEITPLKAKEGMDMVIRLILEIAGTEKTEIEREVEVSTYEVKEEKVSISLSFINDILGTKITTDEVEEIFKKLLFNFERNGEEFIVTAPYERLDIRIPEDLVEEVGRVYGYEKVPSLIPVIDKKPRINKEYYYTQKIREVLTSKGFSEVYTYSLQETGDIEIANPLAQDKGCLRTSLKKGLVDSLILNEKYLPLLGLDKVRIFEIGKVFTKDKESLSLGIAVSGKKGSEEEIKKIIEVLSETLSEKVEYVYADNVALLNLDELISKLSPVESYVGLETAGNTTIRFKNFSLYPFVLRDIAVFIKETDNEEELRDLIIREAGALLRNIRLFDVYKKETDGQIMVSYAYNLVFQSDEKTLTDTEVNAIMDKISDRINQKVDWKIR